MVLEKSLDIWCSLTPTETIAAPSFLFIKFCVWMMHLLTFVLSSKASLMQQFDHVASHVRWLSWLIQVRVLALKAALNFLWIAETIRCDLGWRVPFASQTFHMHTHVHMHIYTGWKTRGNVWRIGLWSWSNTWRFHCITLGFWQSWLSPVCCCCCCCCCISIITMWVWSIAWRMKLLVKTQLLVSSFIILLACGCCDEVMTLLSDELMPVTHKPRYVVPWCTAMWQRCQGEGWEGRTPLNSVFNLEKRKWHMQKKKTTSVWNCGGSHFDLNNSFIQILNSHANNPSISFLHGGRSIFSRGWVRTSLSVKWAGFQPWISAPIDGVRAPDRQLALLCL